MTAARDAHTNNIVLGAGEIWLDVLGAGDALQGERYLGDTIGASITVTSERSTVASGDGAVARDLADTTRSVSRVLTATLHDSSIDNWALFILGTPGNLARPAVSKDTAIGGRIGPLVAGRSYRIGATAVNPAGYTGLADGSLVVEIYDAATGGAASSTAGLADHYTVDYAAGMLHIDADAADAVVGKYALVSTADADSAVIAAATISAAQVGTSVRSIRAAVRYIEDPSTGRARHAYARKCTVVPSGEAQLKSRDTEQQFQIECVVLDPPAETGGGARYPSLVIHE